MARKLGRHRQSDGACTYYKNLRYGVSHFTNVAVGPLFTVVNLWQSPRFSPPLNCMRALFIGLVKNNLYRL